MSKEINNKLNKVMRSVDNCSWSYDYDSTKVESGFTALPLVRAGDGGLWVPVYIYVTDCKVPT